jgi:Flp pilus assembly protein TadG
VAGRARHRRGDSGQATAFVVVLAMAFLLCLGLVFDGGGLLRAHSSAHLMAQEAARVGVQQIDWAAYRQGADEVGLDPVEASRAAQAFLADAGATGTVTVDGDTVTVTSTVDYGFVLLPIGSTTVEATATARPYTSPAAPAP